MRAYKFLDMKFGLKALRERRLKQSRINELNDPFELTPYDITDPELRAAFIKTRDDIDANRGVLCFSADWNDPVIWAHYSDKHRGLCLGFEIHKMAENPDDEESGYVKYIDDPLKFPANFSELEENEWLQIVRSILFTKFRHWQYEHEIRVWATLEEEQNGLYFVEFGEELNIVEVIVAVQIVSQTHECDAYGRQFRQTHD